MALTIIDFRHVSGKENAANITKNVSCDEEEQKTPRKESLKKKSNLLYDDTESPLHNSHVMRS
eukprot:15364425-Ditylum_brightwellii.AAC.3